ncbi:STAS domain-containing protein [Verrucomicrobiota bacterium]
MGDELNLMEETRNGVTIVHVETPWLLDPKVSDMLTYRLCSMLESGTDILVIDLGSVSRLTSIFFRSFIIAGKEAKKRKARMAFCGVSPVIKQGFEIAGLDKLFPLFDTEQKAIKELGTD